MVSVSKQFGRKVKGGILQNPARESNAVRGDLFWITNRPIHELEALADSFSQFGYRLRAIRGAKVVSSF
jgi:hypothetical protein